MNIPNENMSTWLVYTCGEGAGLGGSSVTEKEGGRLVGCAVCKGRALFRIYTTAEKTQRPLLGGGALGRAKREQVVLQVVFSLSKCGGSRGEGNPPFLHVEKA